MTTLTNQDRISQSHFDGKPLPTSERQPLWAPPRPLTLEDCHRLLPPHDRTRTSRPLGNRTSLHIVRQGQTKLVPENSVFIFTYRKWPFLTFGPYVDPDDPFVCRLSPVRSHEKATADRITLFSPFIVTWDRSSNTFFWERRTHKGRYPFPNGNTPLILTGKGRILTGATNPEEGETCPDCGGLTNP